VTNAYLASVKSVLGCVTSQPIVRNSKHFPGENPLQSLHFPRSPTLLSDSDLGLEFWHYFREVWIEDTYEWRVRVESYRYHIVDHRTRHELFAFHWDPVLKVTFPHMHLGFGMRGHALPIDNKAHIPTGKVPIEDVVVFAISELRIKPLVPDWKDKITAAKERFMQLA